MSILRKKGYSLKDIGDALGRPKSAIWYELQKVRKKQAYDPKTAEHITYVKRRRGRKTGKKIVRTKELRDFVEKHLLDDQSPEEIAKRITRRERHLPRISARAIRRYITSVYGRRIEAHRKKLFRKHRRHPPKKRIQGKRMIDVRPEKIAKRWGLGHFEGDFIVSGKSGIGMVLGLRDRKVRKTLLEQILPVSVKNVERALIRMKKRYPEMQSITFDNDILFLEHKRLERILGIRIYFTHPHAPWEKPTIERMNKDLRRYIPKGADISKYSRRFIRSLEEKFNRRFMDVIDSYTPDEYYAREQQKIARRRARRKRSK